MLDVRFPFQGSVGVPFWCIYMPQNAAYNGLLDAPTEISETRIVQCSINAVDRRPDTSLPGRAQGTVRCQAMVVSVVTLADLFALPIEQVQSDSVGAFPNVQAVTWNGWYFLASDHESDVSDWAICREIDGVVHVLVTGLFDFHENFMYAGHRLLQPAERDRLGLGLSNS